MNPLLVVVGIFFVIVLVMIAKAVVIVPEGHRAGVVRLGRYLRSVGPGLHISVPLIDLVTKVDLDANIPGWQGLSGRELEAAVESFVTIGAVSGPKFGRNRSAAASGSPGGAEAEALTAWLLETASDQCGVDLSNDPMARSRIAERAQGAVEELRSTGSCEINLPFLTADATGPKHFAASLTRAKLEEILTGRG